MPCAGLFLGGSSVDYMQIIPLFVLAAVYLVCMCFLVWVARAHRAWYTAAKALQSGLFLVVCIVANGGISGSHMFYLLGLALVLCAGGDIMLGLANKTKKLRTKPFLAGALSFLLAHIVLCVLLWLLQPLHAAELLVPAAFIAVLRILEKRGAVRLRSMRAMAYVYTAFVSYMAAKGVLVFPLLPTPAAWLLALGSVLFFASDVVLLFLYFGVKRPKILRPMNLCLYYYAVFLLSLCAKWL